MKSIALLVALIFGYSCSTYSVPESENQSPSLVNFESRHRLFIKLEVSKSNFQSTCPFNKNGLEVSLLRYLKKYERVSVVLNEEDATESVLIGISCGAHLKHENWGWNIFGYITTLSFIPMTHQIPVYTSVKILSHDLGEEIPVELKRDAFLINHYLGLFFPTPLALGRTEEGANESFGEDIGVKVMRGIVSQRNSDISLVREER